jgi:hypothetical protein
MRQLILLLLTVFSLTLTSCRDDFEFESSTGDLEFSDQTVYLDTVFTNIGSSTYTLKVYNRSNKDISIPSIKLAQGEQSKYRLMIDGDGYGSGSVPGKIFNNVELLAKDSLFIFIETTIDYTQYASNSTTYLYTDKIVFDSGNNYQDVDLVTLVQDAIFIKPNRPLATNIKEMLLVNGIESGIEGHELSTSAELHWTRQKPYVIYGYALVPNGKTLEIDPGTRVHFHAESGLIVDNTATININGSASANRILMENEVVFEGDRLEPMYDDIPGQWGAFWIMSGSAANTVNHLTLKNATIGLLVQRSTGNPNTTPNISLNNTQIYNCSNYGILASAATITGNNVVINNAGVAGAALTYGGIYNFKHSTFGNYFNSYQQVPVAVNDYVELADNTTLVNNLTANFDNCIMYGSGNIGLSLERRGADSTTFSTRFNHCLIKLIDYSSILDDNALYPYEANIPALATYTGCIFAESSTTNTPGFEDPQNNRLNIFSGTEGEGPNGTADPAVAQQIPLDIVNVTRSGTAPDIGAYESVMAPE